MFSRKKIGQHLLLLTLVIGGFLLAKNVLALDAGVDVVSNTIQLGASDPRTIVARIINVVMMFLGALAVGLVIFAGFKWMSSNGNEEQVESAKKILKAAVIGLVIILASWGIVTFILNRLLGATGANPTTPCVGANCSNLVLPDCTGPGCAGTSCDSSPVGSCQADSSICRTDLGFVCSSDQGCTCQYCSGPGCPGTSCDDSALPGCTYSTSSCLSGLTCSSADNCTCQAVKGGNYGDACNKNIATDTDPNPTCDADNTKCDSNQGLTCDTTTCTCLGSPVITGISPVGGFCAGNVNQSCAVDGDCGSTGPCNLDAPNGAVNNLLSIQGYNFGTSSSGLSQVSFLGNESDPADDKVATNPNTINTNCADTWNNNEIVVAIPAATVLGPIKVRNGNLNSNLIDFDTTGDSVGPEIPAFVPNTIVRPGICKITPASGALGDVINYYGNNLSGAGYFGNEANKFKGISSSFSNDKSSGFTSVPGVGAGYMSTFVVNLANLKSNYVSFHKNEEPPAPPSISSIDPKAGAPGQYVTIRGSGFGNSRGTSQVFFGTKEADYNFPDACLHSVWGDDQVIVKVPVGVVNGNYNIKMKLGAWPEISSADIFTVNSAAPLLPSLCLVEPSRGPANSQVSFYGEYFGSSTTASLGTARFYNNKDTFNGVLTKEGITNKLVAAVPLDAITGPVKIVDNARVGNSLNFTVGSCSSNSDCGTGLPYCCPLGSPKQGQCTLGLLNFTNGCYSNILTSVFEWKFGTSMAVPCDKDLLAAKCQPDDAMCDNINLKCDPNSCTCQPCTTAGCGTESYYSCAQKGAAGNFCPSGFCPNSPGQCSSGSTTGLEIKDLGLSCADDACDKFSYCSGKTCSYYPSLNRCAKKSAENCNTSTSTELTFSDGTKKSLLQECKNYAPGQNRWEITVPGSCPNGWSNIGGGKCAKNNSSCGVCSTGSVCVAQSGGSDLCVTDEICPSGSTCNSSSKKCEKSDSASCSCCCEIGQSERDCCGGVINGQTYQLTCAGTCGAGTVGGKSLGSCSGCASVGASLDDNDAACNCSKASGKLCQNNICVDCTSLSSETDCTKHSSTCCWDDSAKGGGICRGGSGKDITATSTDPGYGHCAFYACASSGVNACNQTAPHTYSASSTNPFINYIFKDKAQCAGCNSDPNAVCATASTNIGCQNLSGCCWNMKNSVGKCTAGTKFDIGADRGICAYYNCQTGLNSNKCDVTKPTKNGAYASSTACALGCTIPSMGASCATTATSTVSTPQSCNVSICSAPFGCLNASGYSVNSTTPATTSGGCGFCCCDPNDTTNNQCAAINPILKCYADKGSCSGASRGLCCGCQNDSQCGDSSINGCSTDSCCHARPKVTSAVPAAEATNICRNAVVSVTFSEKMDNASLPGNLILLSEASGACPAGTSRLALGDEASSKNIFARIYNYIFGSVKRISNQIARLFSSNQAMAYSIDANKNYCVTPGITTYESTNSDTTLNFAPSALLQPGTDYIAVVRGQEFLDSMASSTASSTVGVLSSYRVGMAGTGIYSGPFGDSQLIFKNSYNWHFKTMDDNSATLGLCLVDSVEVAPSSYLFQKNTNDDIRENDSDSSNPTFDTIFDRDKLYTSKALSSDGQILQAIPSVYDWGWKWSISDYSKLNFVPNTGLVGTDNRQLLGVQAGITDAKVIVTAETVMNSSNVIVTPDKTKDVNAYVFVCANPWPPVNSNNQWEPSRDLAGSDSTGANYGNYNYEFYYCRDAGDPNTTNDDLPAISYGSNIINLGLSKRNVCSNNRDTDCTTNPNICINGGFCIPDILKESYFFGQ